MSQRKKGFAPFAPDPRSLYLYEGPILRFEKPVMNKWKAQTYAVSEKQALNNLRCQAKQMLNLAMNVNISLPGKLTCRSTGR